MKSRCARRVGFVAGRLHPDAALALLLTAQLALAALLGAAVAAVFADIVAHEDLAFVDSPAARFVAALREPWLTSALAVVTWAGSSAFLVALLTVVGLGRRRAVRSWRPLILLAASLAGAVALSNLVKLVIARPRPETGALVEALGYGFPSGHATAAVAVWLGVAILLGSSTPSRGRKRALVAIALLVAGIVGFSRVYLGVHQPTDVLGGWALGGVWIAIVLVTARAWPDRSAAKPD